jgi:CBS domain-containing protein
MICPNCGHDNLPGSEECSRCLQDLTQLDLPTAQNRVERSLMEDPVHALKPRNPVTILPDAPIQTAIDLLLRENVGAVLVVDESGKLAGILSERDLLTKAAERADSFANLLVRDIMTPNPETVTADDSLAFAVHKMDVGGYRHVPVVREGRPSGVLSARDLLRHIVRMCKDI